MATAKKRGIAPQALRTHDGITTCFFETFLNVFKNCDVAVGNDGNAEVTLDFADETPVRGSAFFSFVLTCAAMNAKYGSPSILNHLGILNKSVS
jgi:hypothetical protein